MRVELVDCNKMPIEVISWAAGTSYGKDDISKKRVEHCIKNGHLSVLEHVSATWKVLGISRSCSHQLVRHRLASYTEKSLRYTSPSLDNDDWYVTPPDILNDADALCEYKRAMALLRDQYLMMTNIFKMKKEDARFVLPLATKTDITITMNFRELMHFYDLRSGKDAQWEIRALCNDMVKFLSEYSDDWAWLIAQYIIAKSCFSKSNLKSAAASAFAPLA